MHAPRPPVRKLNPPFTAYQLPIYQNGWSIYLQLIMLDALQIFGYENWENVEKYMRCCHKAKDIRDHYYRVYLKYTVDTIITNKQNDQHKNASKNEKSSDIIPKMVLIDSPQFNPFKKGELMQKQRKAKQHSDARKSQIEDLQQAQAQLHQAHSEPPKQLSKIPRQFGFEQYKKTFAQPYNQQAQIMILKLKIDEGDSEEQRKEKIAILKEYNKMIQERKIVQEQVIQRNLMECKYTLNTKQQISVAQSQNLLHQSSQIPKKKRIKLDPSSHSKSKPQSLQTQLKFRIKRPLHEDLSSALYVTYMKLYKFDTNGEMKQLLKEYQLACGRLADERKMLMEG